MRQLSIYLFICILSFTCGQQFTRIRHSLYFKEKLYSDIVQANQNGQSLVLLNTFMGGIKYDTKQNIGIILAQEPDYDLCDSSLLDKSKKDYFQGIFNLQMYVFIKLSNNCPFGAQVREASLIGAKGVIIYDPIGNRRDSPFPEINVDHVDIPVLIIESIQIGEKIFTALKNEDYDSHYILGQISFQSPPKTKYPKIQYFFSSIHKQSLQFIKRLYQFIKDYDQNQVISILPYPMIFNSTELTKVCSTQSCLENTQISIQDKDCYFKGSYCTIHSVNYFKPKDVLDHELFQYELAKISTIEWAKYMRAFIEECVYLAEENKKGGLDLTDCGEQILSAYNKPLLNQVLRNVKDTWLQGSDKQIDYNTMNNLSFDKIKKDIDLYHIHQWPTIVVNGQLLQENNLDVQDYLARALCNSIIDPQKNCKDLLELGSKQDPDDINDLGDNFNDGRSGKVIRPSKKGGPSKALVITFSLLGGFLLGAIIFYLVRRNHIRDMNQQLDKKVKQAVQKYKKFNEVNAQFQELV